MMSSLLLLLSLSSQASSGGISLGQTRIVFSAADKAQTVTVSNSGQRAYLIQARVHNGLDETSLAPFIVTPPLFRLAGESRQMLRILPQVGTLPTERESLFYLSVSAIPAQAEPITAADRLSVGVRFVVKLFYRPLGLTPPAESTPCLLTFTREAQGLRVANPTGYFQTLGRLTVNGRDVMLDGQASMVPPQGSLTLAIQGLANLVSWQTVTDYGGLSATCQQTRPPIAETLP
ncbi:fimbrial biogenesis chaperone (plasmid) [Serratia sp. L9]|uniref:fimbrial biogenesis chaperone n=1 Tax=Serratia sp. L9 TaxID=3423946 RepID=UPI003D66DEF4